MSYLFTNTEGVKVYTGVSRDFPEEGWIQACSYCESPTSKYYNVEKNIKKKKCKFLIYFCKECKVNKWKKWEKRIIKNLT